MTFMFWGAINFNQDLSNWIVTGVTNMEGVFQQATAFNGDISNWDVSNVTKADKMFYFATNFNGDISNWDVSNLTNASYMFSNASSFNQDISTWDVSNVSGMSMMFFQAISFNQDISTWNVSNVNSFYEIFDNAPLSENKKCAIHISFSSNANWPYDWSEFCLHANSLSISMDEDIPILSHFSIENNYQSSELYFHIEQWPSNGWVDVSHELT